MRLTFRTKLLLLVGCALLSLGLVVGVSEFVGVKLRAELADVESRLVPKLELGPLLDAEFMRLRQGVQDAVAAQDMGALEGTVSIKIRLFDLINGAGAALDPAIAASLRWSVQDYYETARGISRRLIEGEGGEDIVDAMTEMHARQRKVEAIIKSATGLDRSQLSAGFAAARRASESAARFRLGIGLVGTASVLALWLWASREMLRTLAQLSGGFGRFATGDLTYSIPVKTGDELGDVAREANQMAASLHLLGQERDRADWIKSSLAELSDELRGSNEPQVVAEHALSFLIRRTEAVAGALYLDDGQGVLELVQEHAGSSGAEGAVPPAEGPVRRFAVGEGLVGQAFVNGEIQVIEDPPEGYFKIRSGLGESSPRVLVLIPLARFGKSVGVAELALWGSLSAEARELLVSARTMLVIAFEAASADFALRKLLLETQQQAEQLATQEEELRVNNRELAAQQEELTSVNDELAAQQKILSDHNVELELAQERVQQKAEELGKVSLYKTQFLANMSHELRTPLNSMLLLSHLLAENEAANLTPKQVEYCMTIHAAGEDLLGLINQVLDLSKIEAGKQETDIQQVPLTRFASYARHIFEPQAAQKGLTLAIEIAEDVPQEVATDRLRVERILTNLLGNAIKFTESGEVKLRIARPASDAHFVRGDLSAATAVAFIVSDTGIGVEKAEQGRVFAAFEQIEARSDRRYQGTGLGLAIARESAALLGGEIQLESEVGRGSTFTCYLPVRPLLREPTYHVEVPPLVDDDRTTRSPDEPYLLVIEDDRVLSEQLVELVRARSFKVIVATTGQEGLIQARESPPQGIILDVKLPDIDGWTVMERLRRDPRTRHVPVHFLSSLDAPENGLALGAIGYLTKPASRTELNGLIRSLVQQHNGSRKVLVVEDSRLEGQSIVALLETQNFEAKHVTSAAAALEELQGGRYGCMILDLGLPDMDGLGLLEILRTQADFAGTRVVVHTGRSLTKKETRQLEAYAQAIVLKDGSSATRLLEEIRLFVHHVREHAPPEEDASGGLHPNDSSLVGKKILVAEDDMRTVYSLSALLQSRGSEVIVAENGREALQELEAHPNVHAVLMDLMMPEMDGYEAIRKLRQDNRFQGLPVIALTAKAMNGERERCIEAGASDYLTKPVDSKKLLLTLQDWLTRGSSRV